MVHKCERNILHPAYQVSYYQGGHNSKKSFKQTKFEDHPDHVGKAVHGLCDIEVQTGNMEF